MKDIKEKVRDKNPKIRNPASRLPKELVRSAMLGAKEKSSIMADKIGRETGGLKDTVQPYNLFDNTGNGFTFDRYESGLLYDAINRAKTLYFENRKYWDEMVVRDMNKDVSWQQSAKQYKDMYVELTPKY